MADEEEVPSGDGAFDPSGAMDPRRGGPSRGAGTFIGFGTGASSSSTSSHSLEPESLPVCHSGLDMV